jgi:hypothetical protein
MPPNRVIGKQCGHDGLIARDQWTQPKPGGCELNYHAGTTLQHIARHHDQLTNFRHEHPFILAKSTPYYDQFQPGAMPRTDGAKLDDAHISGI